MNNLNNAKSSMINMQPKYAIKGTLMQIENLLICLCSHKNNTLKNFAFLILGVLELYTRKVCKMFVYKHTETIEYVKN